MKDPLKHTDWYLAAALLFAVAAALPLLEPNALLNTRGGGDSPFLLQRTHQLMEALRMGQFPARWMPDAYYGNGYPFFNFYAPLSIYVAAAFKWLGLSFTRAIQMAQLSGFVLAGWAVYRLLECMGRPKWAALLSSVVYTFAPFHLVNVYVRGDSLAEFWAMAFYPLCLLSAENLLNITSENRSQQRWRAIFALAASFGGLVLSHNISALIFAPFLLLYCLLGLAWRGQHRLPLFGMLAGAAVLGVGLSAWFWLPALSEQGLVQLGPVTEGYFSYTRHFRSGDLVQPLLAFDYAVTDGQNPFRMGLVQAVLMLGGAVMALVQLRDVGDGRRFALFGLVTTAVATLMITPLSSWLWANLPLLEFTQFPWRFLSVQALGGALLAGMIVPQQLTNQQLRLGLVAVLLAVVAWASLAQLETDFIYLTDADVSAEKLIDYEWFSGNVGTTISAEYLPADVQPRIASRHPQLAGVVSGEAKLASNMLQGSTRMPIVRAERLVLDVASERAEVVLPVLGWPHTQLAGEHIEELTTEAGLKQVRVDAGRTPLEVRRMRSPIVLFAELVSLVTLLGIGGMMVRLRLWPVRLLGVLLLAVLVAWTVWLVDDFRPNPAWISERTFDTRSWDFAQQAYLHHAPEGILFSNGAILQGYSLDQIDSDTLRVLLDWEAGAGTVTVDLTTPAKPRETAERPVPVLASANGLFNSDDVMSLDLRLPRTLPQAQYLVRLTLSEGVALTETAEPRGDLYLAPVALPSVRVASDVDSLTAEVVAVDAQPNGNLLVQTRWATPSVLPANYQASWKLYDRFGRFFAELDAQPGYGQLPTSYWPANVWIHDWLELPWLATDGVEPYTLVASLRDVRQNETVFQRALAEVSTTEDLTFQPLTPLSVLPIEAESVEAQFGDAFALRGFSAETVNSIYALTLYWETTSKQPPEQQRFVHIVDPATGAVLLQVDSAPQYNTSPTASWQPDTLYPDVVAIDIAQLSPGSYELRIGLYQQRNGTFPRLPVTASLLDVSDDALILSTPLVIE